jgi:hypothetical protein
MIERVSVANGDDDTDMDKHIVHTRKLLRKRYGAF